MHQAQAEEPRDRLQEAAAAAGFEVSIPQLHRWQRLRLLPRPRQEGLGRHKGSKTLYPPGTSDQVVALCARLAKQRSLQAAAWTLWWDGFRIEEPVVRGLISRQLDRLFAVQREVDRLDDPHAPEDGRNNLLDLLDQTERAQRLAPLVGRMRRRIGKRQMPTLMRIMFSTIAGRMPSLEDDDAKIAARGFGLGMSAEGITEQLANVAALLDPLKLRIAFERASFADLEQARDEVRRGLAAVLTGLQVIQGILGVKLDETMVEVLRHPLPAEGRTFLLMWLSVRDHPLARPAYSELLGWERDSATESRHES